MANTARPSTSRKKTAATSNIPSEAIAARAFELYTARGGSHGQDLADWLQAERELAPPPAARARRKSDPKPASLA